MRKKVFIGVFITLLFFLAFLVFILKDSPTESYTIGVILPLTGSRANAGNDGMDGIKLAMATIQERKASLAEKIRLVYEDNASKPDGSVSALKKLITANHARIVIGPLASSTALSCVPLANNARVLLYLPTSSSPQLSGIGKYIFRSGVLSEQQAAKAAHYVFTTMNAKTTAILFMADDTGEGYRRAFTDAFKALGGGILLQESYSPDALNFRSHLTKIKAASPDIIYVPATARSLAIILNQATELGIHTTIISNFGVEGSDLITLAKQNAEGVLYTSIYLDSQVAEKYKAKHTKELNVVSALCFDALIAVTDAINHVGIDDPNAICQYLEDTKEIEGATGVFTFNEDHDTIRDMIIKTVKNGRFVIKE